MSNLEVQKTSLYRLSCSHIYFVRLDWGNNARYVRLNLSKKKAKGLSWGDLTLQPTNFGKSRSLKTALTAHLISDFVWGFYLMWNAGATLLMMVGAEALHVLLSRHQHLVHSYSTHSVPAKALLLPALCCASQVSGGRHTQTSLCLFSSTCWAIMLRHKSFPMRLCLKEMSS